MRYTYWEGVVRITLGWVNRSFSYAVSSVGTIFMIQGFAFRFSCLGQLSLKTMQFQRGSTRNAISKEIIAEQHLVKVNSGNFRGNDCLGDVIVYHIPLLRLSALQLILSS